MRSFAFSTRAVACSPLDLNRAVQALTALSSPKDGSRQDSGHSPCRGPARGRSPRARISIFSPVQFDFLCSKGTCLVRLALSERALFSSAA